MKTNFWVPVTALLTVLVILVLIGQKRPVETRIHEAEEQEQQSAAYIEARMKYEYEMLKDPATGVIPAGIFEKEKAFARTLPVRTYDSYSSNGLMRLTALNNYIAAGPNNIGGRTRAVQYDRLYSTTGVIIAGCVSGGIMRSTDRGATWTLVTPDNDIHNLSALAQDPRPGQENTWYAGGGEPIGNTASEIGAPYLGNGIWKSTNNGATWTKLAMNAITDINGATISPGTLESFDHPFDMVHRITINPINGDVYVAGHRRLLKSTNGGSSFQTVFSGTQGATSATGQMDIAITNTGRVLLAVNGGFPEANLRGVWTSTSGDKNSFTRIAGGQTVGVDSVSGWRGNSSTAASKRILVTLAPSNNNIGYVFYENGLSSDAPSLKPEADLFRLDISGSSFTWTNRSANMPDMPGSNASNSDPLTVQGGYDMEVTVKPDNPDVVFVGGTNLYRSTDGFATNANTTWIGGYATNFGYSVYPNSHPDIHRLVFAPSDANRAICGNDGGIQETLNIMAGTVSWNTLPNYQTLQCYNVAIDPGVGRYNFASGSQDNGVRFRDRTGILGTAAADSNNHRLLFSADGAYVGISQDNAGIQNLFFSIQFGRLYRARLINPYPGATEITPNNLTTSSTTAGADQFGEFVTNMRLEADNSDNLYYVNFNRLFRTTSASTVTRSSWTELTGVSATVNPEAQTNPSKIRDIAIRGLGFSRGPYTTAHTLYLGTTNGKIYRLDDPQNAGPSTIPVDITPGGLTGNVQDIAVNPNNDDEVLAVVSNYNTVSIWWTKNGRSSSPTWKNAEGNLTVPSARTCLIVTKKDAANQPTTEYYVGTSVGLYSTVNLGSVLDAGSSPTWQREGAQVLNLAVVPSLAYRPTDNVMVVGTHGNGMYFTSMGTPDFNPNQGTGINPITNDRNFIRTVYPTVSANTIRYQTGNMTGVRKISVQLLNMKGQEVYRVNTSYQDGTIPIQRYAAGVYILNIQSEDNRYRHIQKIIRQ